MNQKAVTHLSLNGTWNLSTIENTLRCDSEVPGSVFETLIDNHHIEDPFYGINESGVQWVYEADWRYEKTFQIHKDFLEHQKIILRFYGLDTFAAVFVNGVRVGITDNMFCQYDFTVQDPDTHLLHEGENEVKVIVESAVRRSRAEIKKYGPALNAMPFDTSCLPGCRIYTKGTVQLWLGLGPKTARFRYLARS